MSVAAVIQARKNAKMKELEEKSKGQLEDQQSKEQSREGWTDIRKFLDDVLHNTRFEAFCGVIIFFNMVLVVIETDAGDNPPEWAGILTHCLLAFYTCELTAKLYVLRLPFFHDKWNVMDFSIVGVDLFLVALSLILSNMPSVAVLRVFKLVRLAKAFKGQSWLHELNSLIRSFACAMKAIFWGILMIILTLTVWGILAVQLIHPVNLRLIEKKPWIYDGCDRCHRAFETVFDSGLTFFQQLVAGDSWGTVSNPIIEEAPWVFLLFLLVLVTVNLTMLNLILAVIVEAGSAAAAEDEHHKAMEMQKEVVKAEGRLVDICAGLDADQSGNLTIEEFLDGFKHNTDFKECLQIMHVTSEDDLNMIFNICDEDDSGDVNYREFVDQLRRIKNSGEELLLHYVTDIRHGVATIRNTLGKFGLDIPKPLLGKKPEPKKEPGHERNPATNSQSPSGISLTVPASGADSTEDTRDNDRLSPAVGDNGSSLSSPEKPCPTDEMLNSEMAEVEEIMNSRAPHTFNDLFASEKLQIELIEKLIKNAVPSISDEKLERILQMNEDLLSMSKTQTGLLNDFIQGSLLSPHDSKAWTLPSSPVLGTVSNPLGAVASTVAVTSNGEPGSKDSGQHEDGNEPPGGPTGVGVGISGSVASVTERRPPMCGGPPSCCVKVI